MIYDNFKISGTGEALLDFNDLPRMQLKNDNLQCFDIKCDEVLLSMTKMPEECILEAAPFLRRFGSSHGFLPAGYIPERKENPPVMLD